MVNFYMKHALTHQVLVVFWVFGFGSLMPLCLFVFPRPLWFSCTVGWFPSHFALYSFLDLAQRLRPSISLRPLLSSKFSASLATQSELIAIDLINNELRGLLPSFMALIAKALRFVIREQQAHHYSVRVVSKSRDRVSATSSWACVASQLFSVPENLFTENLFICKHI